MRETTPAEIETHICPKCLSHRLPGLMLLSLLWPCLQSGLQVAALGAGSERSSARGAADRPGSGILFLSAERFLELAEGLL